MKSKEFICIGRKENNAFTGNHCISDKQMFSTKPFRFEFEDGEFIIIPHKIVHDYVQNHPEVWHIGLIITDKNDNKVWKPIPYVLLPDEFILTFAA